MDESEETDVPSAATWPIAAAMLSLGDAHPIDGAERPPEERWQDDLDEVRGAGFDAVDLTDSWVRYGDLGPRELSLLAECLRHAELAPLSVSAIRRSVIDEKDGPAHLAYAHRCIDAAAELGAGVISFGLHRALTPEQRERLWFWTSPGHIDDPDDEDGRRLAVTRFRELGRHAQDVGLLLSLELYEDTYLGSGRSAVDLVEEIGMDAVGLNPDIGNLIRAPHPVESWRELLDLTLPYANFWHMKNYARYEDDDRAVYTAVPATMQDGVIDYRTAVKMAASVGFDGVLCVEHYGGDGLSVSAANREYLQRILPWAGRPGAPSRVRQQFGGGAER